MKIEIKVLDKEFYTYEYSKPQKADWYEGSPEINESKLPAYATPGSAAMDLVCTQDVVLYPQERVMIPTGLAVWIASDYARSDGGSGTTAIYSDYRPEKFHAVGLILPRSGLGTKGLVLANTVGVIDEDYKNELMVSAWNSNPPIEYTTGGYPKDKEIKKRHNNRPDEYYKVIELKEGARFAQLMFIPVIKAQWDVVEEFSDPNVTRGGFGSTGV